jgi:hypothetical protein
MSELAGLAMHISIRKSLMIRKLVRLHILGFIGSRFADRQLQVASAEARIRAAGPAISLT